MQNNRFPAHPGIRHIKTLSYSTNSIHDTQEIVEHILYWVGYKKVF